MHNSKGRVVIAEDICVAPAQIPLSDCFETGAIESFRPQAHRSLQTET
jgi:hypothetical protein